MATVQSAAYLERRRDWRVMSVVGTCHFFSHFYQLALLPLFVLINEAEGYSYESLGFLVTVFFTASFALQIPIGFVVDRIGARAILLCGMGLMSIATVLYGLFPQYEAMILFALLAGAGNSVFHPADYSILNATVSRARIGRAFSIHNLGGFVGYAVAPVAMAAVGEAYGWQTAVIAAGIAGLIVLLASIALSGDFRDSSHARRKIAVQNTLGQDLRLLFTPAPLLCLVFFALLASGQLGVQFFADKVFNTAYGVPLVLGNSFITAFVIAAIVGIICGGMYADRSRNPTVVTFLSFIVASVFVLGLALVPPVTAAIYALISGAGFFFGFGFAARDMVVSRIAPPEASGKMFGFVFSGLDIGSAMVPAIYGMLLDDGRPILVFYFAAVFIAVSSFCVLAAGRLVQGRSADVD